MSKLLFFGRLATIESLPTMQVSVYSDLTGKFYLLKPASAVWLGGSALVDVMIAVILVIYLRRASVGFSRTNDLIGSGYISISVGVSFEYPLTALL